MAKAALQRTNAGHAIEFAGVDRVFGKDVRALHDVDLVVKNGEFAALTGPSGCGKTTLLRMVAGLERPTRGDVRVHANSVAYGFQDPRLLPWRSLRENVELPLELAGVDREQRRRRACEALERVGLKDAIEYLPRMCSGGMVMRASVARALVVRPTLLLLDEPFAAVDEVTREELDDMVRALWRADRMTVLLVTHSISEAVRLAERVIVMAANPGRVVEDVTIDLEEDVRSTRTSVGFNEHVRRLQEMLATNTKTLGGAS